MVIRRFRATEWLFSSKLRTNIADTACQIFSHFRRLEGRQTRTAAVAEVAQRYRDSFPTVEGVFRLPQLNRSETVMSLLPPYARDPDFSIAKTKATISLMITLKVSVGEGSFRLESLNIFHNHLFFKKYLLFQKKARVIVEIHRGIDGPVFAQHIVLDSNPWDENRVSPVKGANFCFNYDAELELSSTAL